MMRFLIRTSAILLSCVVPAGAQQGAASVNLQNPGFEAPYPPVASSSDAANLKAKITGTVAQGWQDNSNWADVSVDYGADTSNPHRGASDQRVTITRVAGGAVQFVQPVRLQKSHAYELRVWLRGTPGTSISISLRQSGAPYATYAEGRAAVSPEWREFRAAGIVGEDAAGFLMLRVAEPMTFWADDARLVDVTAASATTTPKAGNLVTGGSFEAGLSFGWSARFQGPMRHAFEDPRPSIDAKTAAEGRQSLRADIPEGDSVEVQSGVFGFNFGRAHTASVWLKASEANVPVQIGFADTDVGTTATVGTQWQRYTLTGTLPFKDYARLRLYCQAPEGGTGRTLWIDGAQVEERATASAGYVPAAPVELTLRLARPGSVVFDGENPPVQVGLGPPVPRGARLRLSMENLSGRRQALPDVSLPRAAFPLPTWGGRARGVFKLTGTVVDAGGRALSAPVALVWSRLPKSKAIAPAQSFFGIHIPLSPYYIALARAVGARWARLHDTSMIGKWAVAETSPGHFEFYDEGVTAAHEAGLSILGMLDGAPAWTTTKPREGGYWGLWNIPDKPDALAQWTTYVQTVTSHYKGRIDAWEVWNEPWGNWWITSGNPNATPQLYGQLQQIAYKTAHAANPNALIVGIDTTRGSDENWTDPALKASGPAFYDVFSFHDYNDVLYGGPTSMAQSQANRFNELQAKYGTPKPLWDTEGGLFGVGSFYAPETGGMPVQEQPAYIVRYDVTMMAAGVRRFFPYAVHTDPVMGGTETVLTEQDRAVKPLLAARAVLASLVDGAGRPTRIEPVKGVDEYTFPPQNRKAVSVLWSYDGATHALPLPKGVQALDVWSNPLPKGWTVSVGVEPVYLVRQ